MSAKPRNRVAVVSAAALLALAAYAPMGQAFNFGDMMNPGRWMGGNHDRYDDDYGYGPYGAPYGPYGGGYGPGFGAPYGGLPGYGGYPGYSGYPGGYAVPGAAPGVAAVPTAPTSSGSDDREIEALKRRIEELEASQQQQRPQTPPQTDWPSAPAFRPMNQY